MIPSEASGQNADESSSDGSPAVWRGTVARLRGSLLMQDATKLVSGTVIAQGIGLAASPLLTRLFSPSDFGIFTVMTAILAIVGVWSTLRLDMMIPPAAAAAAHAFVRLIALCTTAFVVLSIVLVIWASAPIAAMLDLPPGTENVLWLLPLLLVAYGAFTGLRALSVRNGRFGQISRSAVLRVVSMTAFWFALGLLLTPSERFVVMPLGHAIGLLVAAIYLAMGLGKRGRRLLSAVRPRAIGRAAAGQEGMMAAVTLGQTFSVLGQRLPVLVIAGVYGPVPAGYYALAERIVFAPSVVVATAMADIFRQRASALFRQGRSFAPLLVRMAMATFLLSTIGFGMLALGLLPFVGEVFGEQWSPATFTIGALMVAAAAGFATTPFDCTPVIIGARRYVILWQVARFALIALSCFAAAQWGLSFERFLVAIVASRTVMYLTDIVVVNVLARRVSFSPTPVSVSRPRG